MAVSLDTRMSAESMKSSSFSGRKNRLAVYAINIQVLEINGNRLQLT